ncbi:MAG: bifunctional riboflavin kinase/FAD synthetase [Planctomycetaceae bacterium]|nr:bifunctional riboflavin kinase/FAD synthetase [Planctomycetaceae bacterium]
MKRLTGFPETDVDQGCVLSIGNFDGIHLGHQAIVTALVEESQRRGVPATVLTFEPHPASLLAPSRVPPRLTTADQKAALLADLGVDVLVEYPTDWELLKLSPSDFFGQIVVHRFGALGLVEGPNFYFGRDRKGTIDTLREFCIQEELSFEVVEPIEVSGEMVSSSRIRDCLKSSHVAKAATLLGRRYLIAGKVVSGARRGREIHFPTANLDDIETLLPANGVYAAWSRRIHEQACDESYRTAVNIGPNPTFGENSIKVEAHLLDFEGNLYGDLLSLEFVEHIRPIQTFESVDELRRQIPRDLARCRSVLETST